jgi:hypothetical protein
MNGESATESNWSARRTEHAQGDQGNCVAEAAGTIGGSFRHRGWLGRQMPSLQPIVRALDDSIRATIPGLHYAVKWKRPYYGLPKLGWIIELAAYDVSVNVVFFGGADFDSPPPLGTSDRTRYVKLTGLEETHRPELQHWIKQASRTRGWA